MSESQGNPLMLEMVASLVAGDYSARGPISDNLDEVDALFAGLNMLADILDAKQREVDDALELYHNAPALLCTVSLPSGELLGVNRTMATFFGRELHELEGVSLEDLSSDEQQAQYLRDALTRMAELRPVRQGDIEVRLADGQLRQLSMRGVGSRDRRGLIARCSFLDVTEQRQTETELHDSQRLEAVGKLAGGVAHDFNNLITSIYGSVAFARMAAEDNESVEEDLVAIDEAAQSAASLTQQLLAFARRQVVRPELVRVDDVVRRVEMLLRRTLEEKIRFDVQFGGDCWNTLLDPGRLEQVIVNLCINARDAMPDGGRMLVETSNVSLGPTYAQKHPSVEPGDYVMLAVSDDGHGMAEDTLHRIFEPYFTTKGQRGTGLGLATSHGIVKQAGGHIWVYSEPGRGTTFKVYLPRAEGSAKAVPDSAPAEVIGGTETVLLVEDDVEVRRIIERTLRSAGYTVLSAANGNEAIGIAQDHEGIALVITDVVMPEMSGPQMVEKLRAGRPEFRVLFISGYTENAIVHQGVVNEGVELLEKPFLPDDLLRRLRVLLGD
jgi:PAS domain S-box-containing protein